MAELKLEDVQVMSNLSKIHCSSEEQEALFHDLSKILNFVETLQQIDTDAVEPCFQVQEDLVNVFREDEVDLPYTREEFLDNSPSHVGGMIRVPPVIQ